MECLDENTVVEYVEGVLPADSAERVEDHLDSCPSCRQAVLEVAGAADTLSPPTLRAGPSRTEADASGARWLEEAPGRYTIRGERGRGGQARVYTAYDEYMGREVALKALLPSGTRDRTREQNDTTARFMREVRIAGQLNHPSVVNVHELGRRADGSLFYTMELVRGQTLAAMLGACRSLPERLRLLPHFVDVCNGIAYAHSRGVLHRDLKPANIMIGEFGETVLLDWGLATARATERFEPGGSDDPDARPDATADGTALGTPSYMSPEQASGDVAAIDERTDVWGLGAILYEILTGRPPFEGDSSGDTLRKARSKSVLPVSDVCPDAPPALAAVAERALSRPKEKRYATAMEIAREATAYASGQRVSAYDYTAWELLRLFAARHKLALVMGSAVLLTVLVALVAVTVSYRNEQSARAAERQERLVASYHLAQAYADRADRLLDERRYLAARVLAAASLVSNPAHPGSPRHDPAFAEHHPQSDRLRLQADSAVYRSDDRRMLGRVASLETGASVAGLAFSPDGKRLVAAGMDGTISVWDPADWHEIRTLEGHEKGVNRVAVSPDGRLLASTGRDAAVRLWNLESGTPVRTLAGHAGAVIGAVFSPDGRWLVTAGGDKTIRRWEVESGLLLNTIPPTKPGAEPPSAHAAPIFGLAVSPDGSKIASGGIDNHVRLWSPEGDRLNVSGTHESLVMGVAFSPDGARLASACADQTGRIWDARVGSQLFQLEGANTSLYCVTFSPDGRLVAAGGLDGSVHLWDAATGAYLNSHQTHGKRIYALAFSPDGRLLASGGLEAGVHVWEVRARSPVARLVGHQEPEITVALSPDGSRLAAAGGGNALVWSLEERALMHELSGPAGRMHAITFTPDGTWVATGSQDGTVKLWHSGSGKPGRTISTGKPGVCSLAASPDGRWMAAGGFDGTVRLWDLGTGALQSRLQVGEGDVWAVAFSSDGRRLAAACMDGKATVWSVERAECTLTLKGHENFVSGVAFSPRGDLLATSGRDAAIFVWDAATGRKLQRLDDHEAWVQSVAFSPDGKWLASSSDDHTVRLWSVGDWRSRLVIQASDGIQQLAFSLDGKSLAFGDGGDVVVYPLAVPSPGRDPVRLLQQAQTLAGLRLDGFRLEHFRSDNEAEASARKQ